MNKQYVKEQIDAAISELRKEYDRKIGNIYQCQDCGAVALKDQDHICLQGKIAPEIPAKRKTIYDYVISVLSHVVPVTDDPISENSEYTTKGIVSGILAAGYQGSQGSIGAALSEMAKSKRISRRAAIIKTTRTSKAGKKFEKEISGFVYWRK